MVVKIKKTIKTILNWEINKMTISRRWKHKENRGQRREKCKITRQRKTLLKNSPAMFSSKSQGFRFLLRITTTTNFSALCSSPPPPHCDKHPSLFIIYPEYVCLVPDISAENIHSLHNPTKGGKKTSVTWKEERSNTTHDLSADPKSHFMEI